jgi:hypothetical protein
MSIERSDIIDGVGITRDGSSVEMLISDHLEWGDARHLALIAAKVEAYANAALSDQLVGSFPAAIGKAVCISLIWENAPDAEGIRFLQDIAQQVAAAGLKFSHRPLPQGY